MMCLGSAEMGPRVPNVHWMSGYTGRNETITITSAVGIKIIIKHKYQSFFFKIKKGLNLYSK